MYESIPALSALVLEFPAQADADGLLLAWLAAHAGASALLAGLALAVMPQRRTEPRLPLFLLLFGAAYAFPLVGLLGVLAGPRLAQAFRAGDETEPLQVLTIPPLDERQRLRARFRAAGLRSFLTWTQGPATTRLRAMVALQNVSCRVASPLLRDALVHPSEDIRLLAYGMLDNEEKRLNRAIHAESGRFATAPTDSAEQDAAARRLSDLYWELVYQRLAQGDLRTHALEQSLHYTQLVVARSPGDATWLLRQGRLVQELDTPAAAQPFYRRALALGGPTAQVVPYLAEAAYLQGDYRRVRSLMAGMADWRCVSRLRSVIDYWGRP